MPLEQSCRFGCLGFSRSSSSEWHSKYLKQQTHSCTHARPLQLSGDQFAVLPVLVGLDSVTIVVRVLAEAKGESAGELNSAQQSTSLSQFNHRSHFIITGEA